VVEKYLDSPNGLKQCEVVIFDKLSNFKSWDELVSCSTFGCTIVCAQQREGAQ
jgi:hypothetical protein